MQLCISEQIDNITIKFMWFSTQKKKLHTHTHDNWEQFIARELNKRIVII